MEQTTPHHWLRRSSTVDTVRMQRVPSPAPAPRSRSRPAQQWVISLKFFLSLTPASQCAAGSPGGPTDALRLLLHS